MKTLLKIILLLLTFQISIGNTFAAGKIPEKLNSFDWILDVKENEKINSRAKIVDLDVLDTDKKVVEDLHNSGKIVVGYVNVGAIENYRDDYKKFPKSVVGKTYPGWEDEKFLDVKNYTKFQKLILQRLDIAQKKGFDGIEPDNMDTYENKQETGFEISKQDEINYILWLKGECKKRNLFLIQKNAPELSEKLVKNLDGVLVEGGFYNKIIGDFLVYKKNNKKIFNVEYTDNTTKKYFIENICPKSQKLGIISILKNRDLDSFVLNCPSPQPSPLRGEGVKQKINKKLDNIFAKINKKYSLGKRKILIKNIIKKLEKIKKYPKYKKKIFLINIILERFEIELNKAEIELKKLKTNLDKSENKHFLLKTDFEKDIFLEKKVADSDGVWWQKFGGKNMNLKGYDTQLQFIVDGKKDINKYAKTEIKNTLGKDNKSTKALHIDILKKETGDTQIPLITYTDGKEIDNLHIKYSLKFPKNLAEKFGKNGWAVISEYKTLGDFRLAIYVYSDENKNLYWYMHGDNVVDAPEDYEEFWYRENFETKVPVGEWFDVDLFWKRGVSDGQVIFKVNDKEVLKYYGKTKIKDNINAIMYFTNYASAPIDIWVDNFEVWQDKNLVLQKLIPKKDKIYFGAFQKFGGGETEVSTKKLQNFKNLLDKKPAWAYFSQDFAEEGIKFPKESIEKIIEFGEIPFIRLMPSMVYEKNKKNYNLESIASGKYDEKFRVWAREAKKIKSPILLDFAVEANGEWFYYSQKPELFKKAYKHIIDIFREEKVQNITWFFHFNLQSFPNEKWNKPKNYYPGDDYIDWIGFSLYGTQNPIDENEDFAENLKDNYKDILEVSKNKPVALLEFGVADFNPNYRKSAWLEKTFSIILDNPYIKFDAISIWDEKWEEEDYYSDLRINSSKESLDVYKKYLNKDIFENSLEFRRK